MPKFDWLFLSRLAEVGAAFRTDEHIAYVNAPVLILHALNDCMVPFELGQKVSFQYLNILLQDLIMDIQC